MTQRGRPPKNIRDKQSHTVVVHVTKAEHRRIWREAKRRGQSISAMLRHWIDKLLANSKTPID